MTYIKWFNELQDVSISGGKCASLSNMFINLTSLGIKIPNGFTLTTKAYDYYMIYNNLIGKIDNILKYTNIDDTANLQCNSLKIKNLIIEGSFPNDLTEAILSNYHLLSNNYNDNNGKEQEYTDVAIRSSATSEDLIYASFAGQQDTFLNVRGDNIVLEKIKYCFASLFNDRAICYRKSINYDQNIKLAVCIQKMVRSDLSCSGVAFSLDTESGNNNVVLINATYGLGELLVSGDIIPDEFLVFKPSINNFKNAIIDKKLGHKLHKLVYSDDSDKRTKLIHVNNEKKHEFCMDDIQILQLAKWVSLIEQFYHYPVDIEFAVDGLSNELYIVQARPETTHNNKKNLELLEYVMNDNQSKKVLLSGIAVGNNISSGKVKLIYSLDSQEHINNFNNGDILVTESTDPCYLPLMKKASAVITAKGGRTSHASLVCRELNITCIVGTNNCMDILTNDQEITIDCSQGEIGYVYNNKLNYNVIKTNINNLPKIKTKIMLNVGDPDKAFNFSRIPNEGVGLTRLEFIINNFIKVHPNALINYDKISDIHLKSTINQLIQGYTCPTDYYVRKLSYGISKIASAFYPKQVIVRFSDFKSNEYRDLLGGTLYEPHEENPMIGFRGCSRYYDDTFRNAFGLECQAIKYVRETIGLTNVIVMLPFCRTINECKKVLNIMKDFGLERHKNDLQVYLMCEIPANVILANQFCNLVDGFSIGSNDLTQLVLGLDRDSELIAHIYDERNQAVKLMISQAIKTCKENNVKIGICGNAPSTYTEFAEFLVKENIDSISLTPDAVIKTIKKLYELEQTL